MTPYAWSCLSCTATNPPGSALCGRCACPAEATGAQVESARKAWQRREGFTPPAPFDIAVELQALPLLLIGAGAFGLLGVATLVVSVAVSLPALIALGALLLALSALCLSSYRAPA